MVISSRLKTIASLIEDNIELVDVGCDHAYLDIYLTLNRKNIICYACDINKNSLAAAKNNIDKYNLNNKINLCLCDGIDMVPINDNSVIVISGMGTTTIKHILDNAKSKIARKIVIQSNNDLKDLRIYMNNNGYYICDEKVIMDRNKYYVVIVFEKGFKKYKDYELDYGPIIIKNVFNNIQYFDYLLSKEKEKYKKIPYKHFKLKIKILKNIKRIKKIM